MSILAVLDADVIAYTCAVKSQPPSVDWGDDVQVQDKSHLQFALDEARTMIDHWRTLVMAEKVRLAFSGPSYMNFRRDVYPEYKSKRTSEKPEDYTKLVAALMEEYEYTMSDVLEGDDILGLTTTNDPQAWAVSTDKDIFTLPGNVCRIGYDGKAELHLADELRADRFWMTQTITGDSTDGYKGAPGAGAKAAEKALDGLESLHDMWNAVLKVYMEQFRKPAQKAKFTTGAPYREALANARVARILRDGDFNYETGEVNLWVPQ